MCRKLCWPSCWPVCKNEKEPWDCNFLQLQGSYCFSQGLQLRPGPSSDTRVGGEAAVNGQADAGTGICLPIDGGFSAYSGV